MRTRDSAGVAAAWELTSRAHNPNKRTRGTHGARHCTTTHNTLHSTGGGGRAYTTACGLDRDTAPRTSTGGRTRWRRCCWCYRTGIRTHIADTRRRTPRRSRARLQTSTPRPPRHAQAQPSRPPSWPRPSHLGPRDSGAGQLTGHPATRQVGKLRARAEAPAGGQSMCHTALVDCCLACSGAWQPAHKANKILNRSRE